VFQQVAHHGKFAPCIIITIQVMTFARMSPGYPDGIRTFPKGGKNEFRTHTSGAGDPDDPDIRRVLHPADPCQVCGAIGAPVAQKTDDFYIFFGHVNVSPLTCFTQGENL
jgi:hypothetical protein